MKICVDGSILESNNPIVVEQWIKYGHKDIEDEGNVKEAAAAKKRRKKTED